MWRQTIITLQPRPRGFHLITDELLAQLPELQQCQTGLLHLWLRHTSASLTINENADGAVRRDSSGSSTASCHRVRVDTSMTTRGRTIFRRTSRRACWAAR